MAALYRSNKTSNNSNSSGYDNTLDYSRAISMNFAGWEKTFTEKGMLIINPYNDIGSNTDIYINNIKIGKMVRNSNTNQSIRLPLDVNTNFKRDMNAGTSYSYFIPFLYQDKCRVIDIDNAVHITNSNIPYVFTTEGILCLNDTPYKINNSILIYGGGDGFITYDVVKDDYITTNYTANAYFFPYK